MIKGIQICDSNGLPFYEDLNHFEGNMEGMILSGLISAIGYMSKLLFNQDMASISFGEGTNNYEIIIITKEFIQMEKKIYFVFFVQGHENPYILRKIATTIFIESKEYLKYSVIEYNKVNYMIKNILTTQFSDVAHGLK